MKIQAVLTAVVSMVLMSAGAAYATTATVNGSYTVTYTATHGNGPSSIPKDLATPFSENLTVGTPTSPTNFFTVDPNGSCGSGCVNNTASGTLSVVFSFSNLTVATGSIPSLTEAATYEAKYGGSELGCSNSGTGDTDCVLWGSTTSGYTGTTSITDVIDFTNGDVLDITLYNAQDWDITPQISFDLIDGPTATPLPPALALFSGGLGMMGMLGWRRKRKAAAIAA
jgi:hypothetical protein